jgi:hypothetical protein
MGDAALLDTLLKREGYVAGLGLPTDLPRKRMEFFAGPLLEHNSNINGGNPDRPLVLGSIVLNGDPKLVRKAGIVAGFGGGVNGRHTYGEGRYLDYGLRVSYVHSPEYDIGIARVSANVCSRNHIRNHWYVDACGASSRLVRDLAAETTSGLTIGATKLFTTNRTAFHSASVGIRRHFEESYRHEQILFGLATTRTNGIYTAINFALGESVDNQFVLRRSIQATVGTSLFSKPLSATFGYSFSDGGVLLGFEREDTAKNLSISYAVTPKILVAVGYKRTKSTIDYFSENEPNVSIELAPIRF